MLSMSRNTASRPKCAASRSLFAFAPVGAYDVKKLPTDEVVLRRCRPEIDGYQPLGATQDGFPLLPGLMVYAAGNNVLCWGFNHRDSQLTALDGASEV
jgi:DNA/RNA-binding domain of Phe-tRNA-synthetase-like protein